MSVRTYVRTYVCPSVCPPRACKSEVIYRWIFFLFSLSLLAVCLHLSSSFLRHHTSCPPRLAFIATKCLFRAAPVKSGDERPFFYSALASSRLREIHAAGARVPAGLFSFRAVQTRGMCRRRKSVNVPGD